MTLGQGRFDNGFLEPSGSGLSGGYAASLRGTSSEPTEVSDRPGVAARLAELKQLHDQGLVTDEEHAAARQKILGDL